MRAKYHKGFSLIELLIVILILSIVYFLGFDGLSVNKPKPKTLTPLTLKSTLSSIFPLGEYSTFICTDGCTKCYWRSGIQMPFEPYAQSINLGDIKVYTIDSEDSLTPVEYERYHDNPICLMVDVYPNGSSTQLIIEDSKQSYFLPSFLGETHIFSSPDEAKEYWVQKSKTLFNSGDFY